MAQHSSVVVAAGLIIAVALQLVAADLPVHCLRHQVAGEWEFTLGPLGPKRSSCGHTKPDNPYMQPHMKFLENMGPLSKRRVTLGEPNTVSAEDGSTGTWTMIYDEAFEVAMADTVYFAFSKFSFTDADRQHNISHCDETQIGWYHDTKRSHFSCYVGKKVNANGDDTALPDAKVSQGTPVMALQTFGTASKVVEPPQEQDKTPELALAVEPPQEQRKRKKTEILTS